MESLTCEAGGWAEQGIFALLKHFFGSNIVGCLLLYLQFLLAMMECDARGGSLWARMKRKFPILSSERTFSKACSTSRTAIPTFSCSEASGQMREVIAPPAFAGDQPSKMYRFSGEVGDGLSPAIVSPAKTPRGNQELLLTRRRFLRAPWLHLSALSQSALRCFSNLSGARGHSSGFNHLHPNQLVKGDMPSAKNKQVSIRTSHQHNAFVQRNNIGQILFACSTCFNFIGGANAQDETGKLGDPKVWDTSGYAKVSVVTILVGSIGMEKYQELHTLVATIAGIKSCSQPGVRAAATWCRRPLVKLLVFYAVGLLMTGSAYARDQLLTETYCKPKDSTVWETTGNFVKVAAAVLLGVAG